MSGLEHDQRDTSIGLYSIRSKTDKFGNYILEVPYVHNNELIMDVMGHRPQVEVLKPVSLREELSRRVTEMAEL